MKGIHRTLGAVFMAVMIGSAATTAFPEDADPAIRKKHFLLKDNKLAIQGYDPVSYFQMKPGVGRPDFSHTHLGVTYYFKNAGNLAAFRKAPGKYEPAYGGWCAYAMADGGKTKVNPMTYKIVDGRLFLFYDGLFGNTLKKWNERSGTQGGDNAQIESADRHWKQFLGKNG